MGGKKLILGYMLCAMGCARSCAHEPKIELVKEETSPRDPVAPDIRPLPDGIVLPRLTHGVSAHGEGLRVYLSLTALYFGREQERIAPIGRDAGSEGYSASYKYEKNPNDLLVLPIFDAARSRQEPKQAPVLLFADEATPYRVLVETLYSIGQADYARFFLVGESPRPAKVVGLDLKPPLSEKAPVIVVIVNFGYALVVDDQRVGAECGNGPRKGMAVPRVGDRLDPPGLTACLQRWLPSVLEPRVNIIANPEFPLSDVLATAEAVLAAGATFTFQLVPAAGTSASGSK